MKKFVYFLPLVFGFSSILLVFSSCEKESFGSLITQSDLPPSQNLNNPFSPGSNPNNPFGSGNDSINLGNDPNNPFNLLNNPNNPFNLGGDPTNINTPGLDPNDPFNLNNNPSDGNTPPPSSSGCNNGSNKLTDIDGNQYNVVQIGSKCWMANNLKTSRYSNGSVIPNVMDDIEWSDLENSSMGAWCSYDNNSSNSITYGNLYNYFAVADPRGLCPAGWRIPSLEDWGVMIASLGGEDGVGGKLKSTGTLQAGSGLWQTPNTGANNSSGFSALPAGIRDGTFNDIGEWAEFWTSYEFSISSLSITLEFDEAELGTEEATWEMGLSVRCIKN